MFESCHFTWSMELFLGLLTTFSASIFTLKNVTGCLWQYSKNLLESCLLKTHHEYKVFYRNGYYGYQFIYTFPYIEGRLHMYLKKFDVWHENGLSLKHTLLFLHPLISVNMIVTRQYVFRVTCFDWSMKNG